MNHLLKGFVVLLALSSWAAAAQLDLTEQENAKDLWVDRGDFIVIQLPANPSTGFGWSYSASKPGMLRQEGDVLREGKNQYVANSMVGAPITEVWKLKAVQPGSLAITFSYARPWEKGVPPVKKLSWPVTIRP
jgi:inhibitor of cysteine peptidase